MDFALGSKKRGRGDDEDVAIRTDGTHMDKRQRNTPAFMDFSAFSAMRTPIFRAHTLPFRLDHHPPPSPLPPPTLESTSANDADSPSESSSSNSPASFMSLPVPAELADDVDMNIDEEISIVGSASPPSPYQQHTWLRPAKLNSPSIHDQFSGGRIPTPIYANFQLGTPPQRHNTTSVLDQYPQQSPLHQFSNDSQPVLPAGFTRPHHRPRLSAENEYRIPSPISEDTDFDNDGIDDLASTPTEYASSQLERLSVSQGDDGMEWDSASSVMSSQGYQQQGTTTDEGVDVETGAVPPTPTTAMKMGRARSDAITGSAKRVVFGYREDCAKCRARIPGHWAHFI